jgi:hypothetical protein
MPLGSEIEKTLITAHEVVRCAFDGALVDLAAFRTSQQSANPSRAETVAWVAVPN